MNDSIAPVPSATAHCQTKQDANQFAGQAKRRATRIRPKAVRSAVFGRFANFDKCRSEVTGDVVFGVAADSASTDVRATFDESG